jgi:hypothetical protein
MVRSDSDDDSMQLSSDESDYDDSEATVSELARGEREKKKLA